MPYTVAPCDIDAIGFVNDALTGRVTALLRRGGSVVIGEPLCDGCDQPVSDGPCGCAVPAIRQIRRAA